MKKIIVLALCVFLTGCRLQSTPSGLINAKEKMKQLIVKIDRKIDEINDQNEFDSDVKNIYGRATDSLHLAIDQFYDILFKKLSSRELRKLDEIYNNTGYYAMLDAALENSLLCNIIGVADKLVAVGNKYAQKSIFGSVTKSSLDAIAEAVKKLKENICPKK